MPYMVKSGSKTLGTMKTKSKRKLNSILAKEYRRKNPVSTLRIKGVKKPRRKR